MKIKSIPRQGAMPSKMKRPVAAISPPTRLTLQRVLVPVDFSTCSDKALRYAASAAINFKAGIALLHVVELYPIDYLFGLKTGPEESPRLLVQAQDGLDRLSRQFANGRGRRRVETMVRLGKPHQEIVKAAKERRVQLIIMGTHGYTGFQHFQLGSTAERVVRLAPCPVLVVREQEREFVKLDPHKSAPHELRIHHHSHRTRATTGSHRSEGSIQPKQAA